MPSWYLVLDLAAISGKKPTKEGVYVLTDKKPDLLFYNEGVAQRHAEKLASESVGNLIQVFKAVEVFESQKAPVIRKVYNENGELVPR